MEPALREFDTVVRLEGWPVETAEPLLTEIAERAAEKQLDIDWIHNCLDNRPEGIFLPGASAAVIALPLSERSCNICSLLSDENLRQAYREFDCALAEFERARHIHDEWEKIYISAMDFAAIDALAENTIEKLLGGKQSTEGHGICRDRYFGAATIHGSVDYIQNLTADLPHRYFIKGRPGTGKSTFLKKIGAAAAKRGFDVELYHCALDPESMDLVAVRELGFCVFDSTAPHEYFPEREGDEIIDVYDAAVRPGTDEDNRDALEAVQKRYKAQTAAASDHLKAAYRALQSFSAEYFVLDSAELERQKQEILRKIFG